jgi:beta-glucosidase
MSRIESLIGQMTLAEKLGQLTMTAAGRAVTGPVIAGDSTEAIRAGSIGNLLNLYGAGPVRDLQRLAVEESRLGIPLLFGLDVIHGHRTLFPVPLAEAGTFDPQLWWRSAREAGCEAAADGLAMTFAPMLDVSRDPRWGRTAEGPGEDGWLAARIADAKVRGFQAGGLAAADSLAAVAKHYCAYGPVMAGRDYASVDISERSVLEVHVPAFAAAVSAGVAAVMPAFTDLAGIPMTAHRRLLQDWLRDRLGFDGVIVSDYNAIAELMQHGVAGDLAAAATLALRAGVDIDMMSNAYRFGLPVALERGDVQMQQIDHAVRRVLQLKERLGLFDDPYRRGARAESRAAQTARREFARELATRSIVLLKNEHSALPLARGLHRLALLGPLGDAAVQMGGPWSIAGELPEQISVLAGLRAALSGSEIRHEDGVDIEGDSGAEAGITRALELCRWADVVVLCVGEAAHMSGEAASRATPGLPGRQDELLQAVAQCARARGIALIMLLFSGRPLIIPHLIEQADAVLAAWFPGCEAGHAIADLLTGRSSPSARTPISWPRAVGQIPVYFGQRPSGRPHDPQNNYTSRYLDIANEPLFPFGHGLTYGHFRYSNLDVAPRRVRESDTLEVSVDLLNDGPQLARETVFLFTRDPIASVARPLLELRGFGQLELAPGASSTLRLALPARELRFLGLELRSTFEPGDIEILVGPCADRARLLLATITLTD